MKMKLLTLFALLVFALACGDDDEESEFADLDLGGDAVSGALNGEDWTFVEGETNAFLSEDDSYYVELYPASIEPCGTSGGGTPFVTFQAPHEPGEYEEHIGLSYDEGTDTDEAHFGSPGTVTVDEVTDTAVYGQIDFDYDEDHVLSGHFGAHICPD